MAGRVGERNLAHLGATAQHPTCEECIVGVGLVKMLVRSTLRLKLGAQLRALSALSLSARYRSPFFLARSKRLALLSASEAIASNSLTMSFRGMLRSTNERILASRSIIYSLRLLQVRYEQAVGHAVLKVPDHRRLACRDRDCQRLARRRSELDEIGPVALRAQDHDPVFAGHYSRPVLWHSSSASRFTAAAPGFFILSQSGERPQR